MRQFSRQIESLRIPAFVFLFLLGLILSAITNLSAEEKDQGYCQMLQEQIKLTQQALQAKGQEAQEDKQLDRQLTKRMVEEAMRKKADTLLENGYMFYQEREFEEAMDCFREALAIYPQHKMAMMYLDRSQAELRKVQLKQSKAERVLLRSKMKNQQKEEQLKLQLVEQAKMKQQQYHYLKATGLIKENRYAEAMQELNLVLLLDPGNAQAKKLLANAQAKADGTEAASMELEDTFSLVIGYLQQGDYRRAEKELSGISQGVEKLQQEYQQKNTCEAMTKATQLKSVKVVDYISEDEFDGAKDEIGGLLQEISILAAKQKEQEDNQASREEVSRYFNSTLDAIEEGNYAQARLRLEKILEIDPKNEEAAALLERVKEVIIISADE